MTSMEELREQIVAAIEEPREEGFEALATGSLIMAFNHMAPEELWIEAPAWLAAMRKPHPPMP